MTKRFLAGLMVMTMILSGSISTKAAELSADAELTSEDNVIMQMEDEVREEQQEEQTDEETDETGENENETGEDGADEVETDTEEAEDVEAEGETAKEEEIEEKSEAVDVEDTHAFESQEAVETEYVLNPIYASEYTIEDLITLIAEKEASNDDQAYKAAYDAYEAGSIEYATSLVKDMMKVRETDCIIQVPRSISFKDIFQAALVDNLTTAPNEGDYLRANWYGYEMGGYITGDTAVYHCTIMYVDNAEQEAAVTNRIPSVLNSMNLDGKTEFEKIKTIHDYVCDLITYEDDGTLLCHSTYAALINGKAVCQGYASLFYRLCREAGISTRFITGLGNGGNHAWNIVRIGNYYYNVDATWDDGEGYGIFYDYFLKNDADFEDHVRMPDVRDGLDYSSAAFYTEYPMAPISYRDSYRDPTADNPFIDVPENTWYTNPVKFLYKNNIMGGVGGSNQFQPNNSLTRAMFATVLYRMAGEPNVKYSSKFNDVEAGKWYSDAVLWANQNDIVSGYTDGNYGINDNITREQIAKMLYLYGKSQGYDVSGVSSLDSFTDKNAVSGWAVDYMRWAVNVQMISGKPNGDGTFRLDPRGQATRAECAKMLMMFMEKYK